MDGVAEPHPADYGNAAYAAAGRLYEDLIIRIEGPAAGTVNAIFRGDWFAEAEGLLREDVAPPESAGSVVCQVLPSGPAHAYENNLRVLLALVYAARSRLTFTNPYLVPDDSLVVALATAAQRGVAVTLITDEAGNHPLLRLAPRPYYESLLEAGCRVLLHPAPTLLHSQTLTVDDHVALVGSSKVDMRSFHLNLAVSTLCYDEDVVAAVRAQEDR